MQHSRPEPHVNALEYPEVLVISPDLSLTHFLTEGLFPHGFWMSAVRSGLQALEVFRLRGFDVLIVDAAVADLPLDELVRRLRGDERAPGHADRFSVGIPVVVIAGIPQELEPYDLPDLGVDACFVAPFELEEVAQVLNTLTSNRPGSNDSDQ
jgi:DNA-binding response OmpR family regulator